MKGIPFCAGLASSRTRDDRCRLEMLKADIEDWLNTSVSFMDFVYDRLVLVSGIEVAMRNAA